MKNSLRSLASLSFLLIGSVASARPSIAAAYGTPVPYRGVDLQYSDFSLCLFGHDEYERREGGDRWIVEEFYTENRGRSEGGGFQFNSDARANARRFQMGTRFYIAEMFSTTAGSPTDRPTSHPLAAGAIIIWDEASAALRNPVLLSFLSTPAGTHPRQPTAYVNGHPVTPFDGTSVVEEPGTGDAQALRAKPVMLVDRRFGIGTALKETIRFGTVVPFEHVILVGPGFKIQLEDVHESRADARNQFQRSFRFAIFGGSQPSGFIGLADHGINGSAFTVEGKEYVVEIGRTTEGLADTPENGTGGTPLPPGHLILWDQATATVRNPILAHAWQPKPEKENPFPGWPGLWGAFAAGRPIESGFTGSIAFPGRKFPVIRLIDLDAPPRIITSLPAVYPAALHGSGYVGQVHGFVVLNADGTVDLGMVTHGQERRFAHALGELNQWKFSAPTRGGQPTKVLLNFTADIAEGVPAVLTWES